MSISVGRLQERRVRRAMWPVAFVAVVIMITAAMVAFTLSREGPRTAPPAGAPTEVSGGIVPGTASGTAANTPSELPGGIRHRFAESQAPDTVANTPSEVTGGMTRFDQHQRL